jgi:hypothetical protein
MAQRRGHPMEKASDEALQEALSAALRARDEALSELADARAELNALRLRMAHPGESAPGAWTAAGRPALPLRYRVADGVNDRLKAVLGPGHATTKAILQRLRRR